MKAAEVDARPQSFSDRRASKSRFWTAFMPPTQRASLLRWRISGVNRRSIWYPSGDAEDERVVFETVFPVIFVDQLNGWWRDRTMWPTARSFRTVTRWFDWQFLSTLLDLADEPLMTEQV